MEPFPWTCPYCNRDATITDSNFSISNHEFNNKNKLGPLILQSTVITCPNKACREVEILASLHKANNTHLPYEYWQCEPNSILSWKMKPTSAARVFPDYIPRPILQDYEEACSILNLSPKASATLSRRCLQGMIRDYWQVSKKRLIDEINSIEDKVDPLTWQSIDGVRSIGNIGAHMEADINVIVDVDPSEAELLIRLIEILLKDWYITREERKTHLGKIVEMASLKKAQQEGDKA